MNDCVDGMIEGEMNGWVSGLIDRQTDLAIDGSTFIYLLIPSFFSHFFFFILFFDFAEDTILASRSQRQVGKKLDLTEASSTGYRPLTHAAPALSMARRPRLCCLVYSDLVMSASDTSLHTCLPF